MSPFRRKDGATYYLHIRWKGWPEIRVATGTTNKVRAVAMQRTLYALRSAGRRDILELIAPPADSALRTCMRPTAGHPRHWSSSAPGSPVRASGRWSTAGWRGCARPPV